MRYARAPSTSPRGVSGSTARSRAASSHSPAPVMKLAEVVVTQHTSDETVAVVREAATRCGKNPVVVKDNPMQWGFVANRVYFAMVREASRVVDEGIATRDEVDQLMTDCFRWPSGPFGMVKGAGSGWT